MVRLISFQIFVIINIENERRIFMKKAYWIVKDEVVKVMMEHKNMIMIVSKDGCHMVDRKSVFFVEGRLNK